MAAVFAVIEGLKDAKVGRSPYFWLLLSQPADRAATIRNGWRSVGKVFVLALVLDAIYQFIVQGFIYPGEMVIVAVLLAIVPHLVVRGLVTRLASQILRKRQAIASTEAPPFDQLPKR